ncbi:MAG: hypothetical protein F4Y68_17105 [Boseongicola sp. SB0665_bin_10]|nr:hypothetical protein [Boseongicola sp. SB0665_bin_10]
MNQADDEIGRASKQQNALAPTRAATRLKPVRRGTLTRDAVSVTREAMDKSGRQFERLWCGGSRFRDGQGETLRPPHLWRLTVC